MELEVGLPRAFLRVNEGSVAPGFMALETSKLDMKSALAVIIAALASAGAFSLKLSRTAVSSAAWAIVAVVVWGWFERMVLVLCLVN